MTATKKTSPGGKQKLVTARKDGGRDVFDFRCPYPDCNPGGDPFHSTGWADRAHAVARGKEHIHEHETGEVMSGLDEFHAKHGLTQATAGSATKPDDWEF